MSRTSTATTLALAALIFTSMASAASIACAAEPEPWNCSGKQHFQHTDDMTYTAKSNSQRHWRLFLMEYEQYTGHHGYSVVTANDLANAGATAGGVIGTGKFSRWPSTKTQAAFGIVRPAAHPRILRPPTRCTTSASAKAIMRAASHSPSASNT